MPTLQHGIGSFQRQPRTLGSGDSVHKDEQCPRHVEQSGAGRGAVSTVRTAKGNLTIIQGPGGVSVGYDEPTTRRTARRPRKPYGAASSRQTTRPSTDGKLTEGLPLCKKCKCRRVLPVYTLTGRCEDCFAEDQGNLQTPQNVRIFHTVR